MKKNFYLELPRIVAEMGTQVSRQTLKAFCREHNIQMPAILNEHRAGRGVYDLEPLLKKGENLFTPGFGRDDSPEEEDAEPEPEMTDQEVEDDINGRFASLDLMAYGVVRGDFRAMIVSGNPGIGKTFTLEQILQEAADASRILYSSVHGYVRATGLYRLMWEHRWKNCVLMLDDADSVFQDEISLNLLKGALDTTKRRTISWRSEKIFEGEDGDTIPRSFDFDGAIIFVSNINFQRASVADNKLSPHLKALMSRSFYLDLNLTSQRELMVRIKSVVTNSDILTNMGISKKESHVIVDYIQENMARIREMSLRTVLKLGTIYRAAERDLSKFKKMADATHLVRR